MTRILTREEIKMLQYKYIPELYKEYRGMMEALNRLSERLDYIEGEEVWLDEATQRKFLKKLLKHGSQLEKKTEKLKKYLKKIGERLGEEMSL